MVDEISYIIEEFNNEYGYIIFKPYSKNFKKQLNEYQSYKIDVNTISYVDDPRLYLAAISKPIIDEILEKEKNYTPESFLNEFEGMENKIITVNSISPVKDLNYTEDIKNSKLNFIVS